MVFVVYPGPSLSSVAIIVFYTCIWIPFQQMRRALITIIITYSTTTTTTANSSSSTTVCHPGVVDSLMSLPVARFKDLRRSLQSSRSSGGGGNNEDGIIMCSICLVELDQDDDLVSKLPKCNHIFHMDCIHKWVYRDHFTCPLCRSFLFDASATTPNCHPIPNLGQFD